MTIKKMLLLASMALAAIAFAAPAAAQAEAFWTTTSGTVGEGTGNGVAVEAEAEFTSHLGALATTAPIRLEGEVWNGANDGEGKLTAEATGTGRTNLVPPSFGCVVHVTIVGEDWPVTLTTDTDPEAGTEDATIDIEEVGFINHYSSPCTELTGGAIPATGAATGTVTATASTNGDTVDVALEATQDLYPTNPFTWQHTTTAQHVGLTSIPNPLTLRTVDPEGSIGVEQH